MGEWRGSWGRESSSHYKGGVNQQFDSWKNPNLAGSSNSPAFSWEREFCRYLHSIPWKRLCEAQKFTNMYKNITEWDDSAGLEALKNAKSRFFAQYNGQPCDLTLPDPEMYIDQIDHDQKIDPELIEDLERELQPLPPRADVASTVRSGTGWDSFEFTDKPVPSTGWESWDNTGNNSNNNGNSSNNNWDIYVEKPIQATGWGDSNGDWNNCSNNNVNNNNNNNNNNYNGWNSYSGNWESRYAEGNRRNCRKRDGGGVNVRSGVRKPRYQGEGYYSGNYGNNNNSNNNYNNNYRRECRERTSQNYLYKTAYS